MATQPKNTLKAKNSLGIDTGICVGATPRVKCIVCYENGCREDGGRRISRLRLSLGP